MRSTTTYMPSGSFSYATNVTDYTFTPAVVNSTGTFVPSTGRTLVLPADNPFNPFGVWRSRTCATARPSSLPVSFSLNPSRPGFLVGLGGDYEGWNWDAGMIYSFNQVTDTASNAIRANDLSGRPRRDHA